MSERKGGMGHSSILVTSAEETQETRIKPCDQRMPEKGKGNGSKESSLKGLEKKEDPATLLSFLLPAGLVEFKGGSLIRKQFASPNDLSQHLVADPPVASPVDRLYTLRSLPPEYLQILTDHFRLDLDLLDSHAERDSDLLVAGFGRHAARGMRSFALNHVDTVTEALNTSYVYQTPKDLMPYAKRHQFDQGWKDFALFCHVTLIGLMNSNGSETCKQLRSF